MVCGCNNFIAFPNFTWATCSVDPPVNRPIIILPQPSICFEMTWYLNGRPLYVLDSWRIPTGVTDLPVRGWQVQCGTTEIYVGEDATTAIVISNPAVESWGLNLTHEPPQLKSWGPHAGFVYVYYSISNWRLIVCKSPTEKKCGWTAGFLEGSHYCRMIAIYNDRRVFHSSVGIKSLIHKMWISFRMLFQSDLK